MRQIFQFLSLQPSVQLHETIARVHGPHLAWPRRGIDDSDKSELFKVVHYTRVHRIAPSVRQ